MTEQNSESGLDISVIVLSPEQTMPVATESQQVSFSTMASVSKKRGVFASGVKKLLSGGKKLLKRTPGKSPPPKSKPAVLSAQRTRGSLPGSVVMSHQQRFLMLRQNYRFTSISTCNPVSTVGVGTTSLSILHRPQAHPKSKQLKQIRPDRPPKNRSGKWRQLLIIFRQTYSQALRSGCYV